MGQAAAFIISNSMLPAATATAMNPVLQRLSMLEVAPSIWEGHAERTRRAPIISLVLAALFARRIICIINALAFLSPPTTIAGQA